MTSDEDFDMAEFNPAHPQSPDPNALGLLGMDAGTTHPPRGQSPSGTVSPMTIQGYDQSVPSTPDIDVASPALPPVAAPDMELPASKQKPPRQTRFKEMLRRSISSSWQKSIPIPSQENPELFAGRGMEASPVGTPGTPGPNHLHSIAEYEANRNTDDADTFSLKYSETAFIRSLDPRN
jgi:hypothetical protein